MRQAKRSDMPLLDQRQVLTKADLERREASREEEVMSHTTIVLTSFYFLRDFNLGDFDM